MIVISLVRYPEDHTIESEAVNLLPTIATWFDLPQTGSFRFFDPAAGTGAALQNFTDRLPKYSSTVETIGIELSFSRFAQAPGDQRMGPLGDAPYLLGVDFQAVALLLYDNRSEMVILMPAPGTFEEFEQALDGVFQAHPERAFEQRFNVLPAPVQLCIQPGFARTPGGYGHPEGIRPRPGGLFGLFGLPFPRPGTAPTLYAISQPVIYIVPGSPPGTLYRSDFRAAGSCLRSTRSRR